MIARRTNSLITRGIVRHPGLCLALLLSVTAQTAGAQWNLARQEPGQTRLYLTAGVEPAAIGTLGVAHVIGVRARPLQLRVDGSLTAGGWDAADYRARVVGELPVVQRGTLRMAVALAAVNRGTSNTVFRANGIGADAQTTIGLYGRHGFAATELGYDHVIATRLTFTERYRANMPTARNGWYGATAATLRAGLVVGGSVGRTEVLARAGVARTARGEPLVLPVYLSVGVGQRF